MEITIKSLITEPAKKTNTISCSFGVHMKEVRQGNYFLLLSRSWILMAVMNFSFTCSKQLILLTIDLINAFNKYFKTRQWR